MDAARSSLHDGAGVPLRRTAGSGRGAAIAGRGDDDGADAAPAGRSAARYLDARNIPCAVTVEKPIDGFLWIASVTAQPHDLGRLMAIDHAHIRTSSAAIAARS